MSLWDDYDFYSTDGEPRNDKECNRCGVAGLHWEELEPGEWRLFDEGGRMHHCKTIRPRADDFEDLDK